MGSADQVGENILFVDSLNYKSTTQLRLAEKDTRIGQKVLLLPLFLSNLHRKIICKERYLKDHFFLAITFDKILYGLRQ